MAEKIKTMKESNPFKIIGSYIGLFIGIIIAYFAYSTISVYCALRGCSTQAYVLPLLVLIFSFVTGWGIQLLVSSRKKNLN